MSINFNFIDELPSDWRTARVKNILDYTHHYPIGDGDHGSIKPEMYQDEGIPYLRVQNLTWGFDINYDNLVFISDEVNQANNKSILIPKDILIAKTGATVGKMAIVPKSMKQANTTSSVGKVSINHKLFNYKYYAYLFSSPMFQEQIKEKAYQKSAQPGFNIDDLIEFNIIIPPIDIQNKIANYLDKKTAEINATIAKNEELIQLLEEKRVALINQVVTKGLNPDVPMKDSGVEWIGEIPEHWEAVPLTKFLKTKVDYRGKTPEKVDDGIFLVTGKNIKKGKIQYELSQEFVKEEDYNNIMSRGKPEVGDLLFTTEAPLGEVANIDDPQVALAQRIIKMSGKDNILNNYFLKYYIMSSTFQSHLQSLATGSTAQGIKASKLFLLKLLLLPYPEQENIVHYLDKKTNKIDKTISKIKQNITLLKEYKTSLIHHVVTGKIDVRGEEI